MSLKVGFALGVRTFRQRGAGICSPPLGSAKCINIYEMWGISRSCPIPLKTQNLLKIMQKLSINYSLRSEVYDPHLEATCIDCDRSPQRSDCEARSQMLVMALKGIVKTM